MNSGRPQGVPRRWEEIYLKSMSRKKKKITLLKRIAWRLEMFFVRCLEIFFYIFPLPLAYIFTNWLVQFLLLFMPAKKKLIVDNLVKAGMATDEKAARAMLWAIIRTQAWNGVEFFKLGQIHKSGKLDSFCQLEIGSETTRLFKENAPLIIISAHLGNWELAGVRGSLLIPNLYIIAKFQKNPRMNTWLMSRRTRFNIKIINKEGALLPMIRIIKEGGAVAFTNDQNAGRKGIFVDFFGRPASTHKAAAAMAVKYKVPIIIGYDLRQDGRPDKHILKFTEPLEVPDTGESEQDIQKLTQDFTSYIENVIREYPLQYLWGHNRWKHQPGDRKE